MAAFTAPTLSATQEADLETYKQVYEVLDNRRADLATDFNRGRINGRTLSAADKTAQDLQQLVSEKATTLTGCPLGVWLD